MDTLENKRFETGDYTNRYATVAYYYDTLCDREVYGIGANMVQDVVFVTHDVQDNDTLEKLALKYYANPTLWWAIAYFNDIQDPFFHLADYYKKIKVPRISALKFEDRR